MSISTGRVNVSQTTDLAAKRTHVFPKLTVFQHDSGVKLESVSRAPSCSSLRGVLEGCPGTAWRPCLHMRVYCAYFSHWWGSRNLNFMFPALCLGLLKDACVPLHVLVLCACACVLCHCESIAECGHSTVSTCVRAQRIQTPAGEIVSAYWVIGLQEDDKGEYRCVY